MVILVAACQGMDSAVDDTAIKWHRETFSRGGLMQKTL